MPPFCDKHQQWFTLWAPGDTVCEACESERKRPAVDYADKIAERLSEEMGGWDVARAYGAACAREGYNLAMGVKA